jgi:hypothetical protein
MRGSWSWASVDATVTAGVDVSARAARAPGRVEKLHEPIPAPNRRVHGLDTDPAGWREID